MPYPWHIWSFELNSTDMSVFIDPLAFEQGNETSKFSVGTSSNKSAVYMDGCLNGGFPIVRLDSHRSLWRQALEVLWLNHERNGESVLSKTIVVHFYLGQSKNWVQHQIPCKFDVNSQVLDKPISTKCIGQIRSNHVNILLLFSIHGKTMLNPASC